MIYIIYETTNLINGKKYRGMHQTEDIDDGYLGSGKTLLIAVSKYGRENFTREILEYCSSGDELAEREKLYVDENWVNDRTNYNLKVGGNGNPKGYIPWNKGIKGAQVAWNKGLEMGPQSDEVKEKKSNTLKERYKTQEHPTKGREPWNKGIKGAHVAWNKGIKPEKVECPHCGRLTDVANGKRWHFDNCKKFK